jgi:hypothetical protein
MDMQKRISAYFPNIFSLRAKVLSILPILQVEEQLDLLSPTEQTANHPDAHDAERQPYGGTQ